MANFAFKPSIYNSHWHLDLFNHQFTCNASLYIPVCTLHIHICEHTFMSQFERGGVVRNSHRSKLVIIHDCYNAKF